MMDGWEDGGGWERWQRAYNDANMFGCVPVIFLVLENYFEGNLLIPKKVKIASY